MPLLYWMFAAIDDMLWSGTAPSQLPGCTEICGETRFPRNVPTRVDEVTWLIRASSSITCSDVKIAYCLPDVKTFSHNAACISGSPYY